MDKAAVHRHLKKLEEGGLIKKDDDHGFIYYSLTWKARDLISPGDNTRIVVLLSTALVLLVICSILIAVASTGVPGVGKATGANDTEANSLVSDRVQEVQSALYVAVIIVVFVAGIAGFMALSILHPPKQSGASRAEDWEKSDIEEEGRTADQD